MIDEVLEQGGHRSAASVPRPKGLQCSAPAFLRGLVEGVRCGILAVDRDGHLMMINGLGAQILELAEDPAAGVPIEQALGDHPQIGAILRDAFTTENLPNRAELELRPGSAAGKRIGFTVSLIDDGGPQPVGAAMFFKDLTRIEHKEEQERLRDRLAALGQMAAALAHEIRNPLASIEVTCSLLKRRLGAAPSEVALLDQVTQEIRRLNQTVTSSLQYVRPVALHLSRADLAQVLDEAVEVATRRCNQPGIRVAREGCRPIPPFYMDRSQVLQAFVNLILNALEAMGHEGILTLETRLVSAPSHASVPWAPGPGGAAEPRSSFEQFAVVRVADSGPGIPDEARDRIFYPFYTTKTQGSGVGLPTVKKIVDGHRGLIDVGRGPHGGALFTIRLPVVLDVPQECNR